MEAKGSRNMLIFKRAKSTSALFPAMPRGALAAYAAQLARYPYLDAGFDLPYPVPSDLLLPFGDFVKKDSLESGVQRTFLSLKV